MKRRVAPWRRPFEAEGYKNVYALKGGWMPWIMSKYPTESKDTPVTVMPAGKTQ